MPLKIYLWTAIDLHHAAPSLSKHKAHIENEWQVIMQAL